MDWKFRRRRDFRLGETIPRRLGPALRKPIPVGKSASGEEGLELFHTQKSMGKAANFRGHLNIGVGNLMADVMGAIGKRYFIVGIMKFRMMVENLSLDRDLHDERNGVAKGLEFEGSFDVRSLDGPVR
jgi:hypothetical protein